jgi:hypothetical protein
VIPLAAVKPAAAAVVIPAASSPDSVPVRSATITFAAGTWLRSGWSREVSVMVLCRSCPVATVVPEIIEIRIPGPVVVRMSRWPTTVADEGRMPPLPGGRTQWPLPGP